MLCVCFFVGSPVLAATDVVQVPAAPTRPDARQAEPNQIAIRGSSFSAPDVTITVGQSITWTNHDGFAHTVTASDGSFESGRLEQGATFTHVFKTVGKFAYFCSIHPGMQGIVNVVDAMTSDTGSVTEPSTNSASVTIHATGFDPQKIVLKAPVTVTWMNMADNARQLAFEDGTRSGEIPVHGTYTRTFEKAGAYVYFFAQRPDIRGAIIVCDATGCPPDQMDDSGSATTQPSIDQSECQRMYDEASARFRSEVLEPQEMRHKEFHASERTAEEDEAFHRELAQERDSKQSSYYTEADAKCSNDGSSSGDSSSGAGGNECENLRVQAEQNMRDYMVNVDARRKQFKTDLDAAHAEFDAETHTEEEHSQFHSQLRAKIGTFESELQTEIGETRQAYFKEFFERCAQSGSAGGQPQFGSECDGLRQNGETAFRDFLSGIEARRQAFQESQHAAIREFEAGDHSEEERAEFFYKIKASGSDFESQIESEIAGKKDEFFNEFNARCGGHEVYATGAGGEEFRNECEGLGRTAEESFRQFVSQLDARRKDFFTSMEQKRLAFEGERHNATEKEAFFSEWRRAMDDFQRSLQAEIDSKHSEMFRDFEAKCGQFGGFRGSPGEPMLGGGPGPGGFGESQECISLRENARVDFDALRSEQEAKRRTFFEGQAQEKRDFFNAKRTDAEISEFAGRQQKARDALEVEMQAAMRALEERLRKAMSEKCGAPPEGQGGEMQHYGPPPECIEFFKNMEAAGFGFEQERRAAREAFEERMGTLFSKLDDFDLTDLERQQIKKEIDEARYAFDESERSAIQAFKAANSFPEKCRPPGDIGADQIGANACGGEDIYVSTRAFEERLHDERARMEDAIKDKADSFRRNLDEREKDFLATTHTEAELSAFRAKQEKARVEFEETVRHEFAQLESRMRAHLDEYRAEKSGGCFGSDVANATRLGTAPERKQVQRPQRVDDTFEDFRACGEGRHEERLDIDLQVRLKVKDFENEMLRAKVEFLQSGDHTPEEVVDFESLQKQEFERFMASFKSEQARAEGSNRVEFEKCKDLAVKDAKAHERLGNFEITMDESTGTVEVTGKFVSLKGDQATELISEYSVGGQLFLDGVSTTAVFSDFGTDTDPDGVSMKIAGEGFSYNIHDNPTGLWKFRSTDGVQFKVDFADYLAITDKDGTIALTDGTTTAKFIVRGGEYKLEGDVLTFEGEGLFLLKAKREALDKVANSATDELDAAVEKGTLGGEVTIVKKDDSSRVDETLEYEDITLTVEAPKADKGVSVRVSSVEETGKVIVLNVDKSIVEGANAVVKLFDVTTGAETEVKITKASSLTALLAASGTESQYWIVTDEDGVQVLVYVGHFSEKRIEVQSAEAGTQDEAKPKSPIPGFEPLAFIGAAALVAIASRRSKKD
ncbi:MAG: hypothetical protein HY556_05545 [Euryarchaeota archaeon]|nr:hypothetical protein [Euryarchaeota archaeon]